MNALTISHGINSAPRKFEELLINFKFGPDGKVLELGGDRE